MLERRIYQVLDAGRELVNEDPKFIVDYFCRQGLSDAEAAGIRDYWLRQDEFYRRSLDNTQYEKVVGVNIVHQFPRSSDQPQFPCWAIVLTDEREDSGNKSRFLGDEVDDEVVDGVLTSFSGSVEKKTIAVYTYADSPDVCVYYYQLCKFFLKRARDVLKGPDIGILDSAFSGSDMAPDPRYEPENMFVRRFVIEATVLDVVRKSPQEDRAFVLSGAFLRNEEGLDVTTSSDGETINPNVTVIGGEE